MQKKILNIVHINQRSIYVFFCIFFGNSYLCLLSLLIYLFAISLRIVSTFTPQTGFAKGLINFHTHAYKCKCKSVGKFFFYSHTIDHHHRFTINFTMERITVIQSTSYAFHYYANFIFIASPNTFTHLRIT